MGDYDEKQIEKEEEPGIPCPANCIMLEALMTRCYDVNDINVNSEDYTEHIDHCLEKHVDFRTECIFEKCDVTDKLKELNNDRFIQLHAHFYHDIAIDADENDDDTKEHHGTMNDEQIQYKLSLHTNEENEEQMHSLCCI